MERELRPSLFLSAVAERLHCRFGFSLSDRTSFGGRFQDEATRRSAATQYLRFAFFALPSHRVRRALCHAFNVRLRTDSGKVPGPAERAPHRQPGPMHVHRDSAIVSGLQSIERFPLGARKSQLVPYRSLPSLLPFDFEQEERGLLSH